MSLHRSTLATVLQSTVNYLIHENIDAEELLRRADIDPEIIYDSGARLPEYLSTRFWNIVIDETGDPYLYYKVVEFVEPGMLHAFGYAWMVSRTLREALTRLTRYHRLITPNVEFRMERGQGVIQIIAREVNTDDPVDGVVPFTLRLCRISGGDQLRPLQVELQCNPPDDPSLIEKFYGSEVRFNCSENVITFSAHDLETRVKGNNAEIAVAMDIVIQDYLARYDKDDVVSRVRKVVAETLIYGEPDKQTIAEAMHLSPRTLQRRLEEKGSSVKEIVDDTRHQMALDYLGRTNYSIKETSFDLGFSDPSNFTRAFKRWEGVSPSQFRRAEKR